MYMIYNVATHQMECWFEDTFVYAVEDAEWVELAQEMAKVRKGVR